MNSDHGALLALGVSRIHRSTSIEALMDSFMSVAPLVVDADAFGLYLLDDELRARVIYAVRADRRFLTEYERLRMTDPCFLHLLRHRSFIHTREIVAGRDWNTHPLQQFMSRWGLRYSIEAPLVSGGRLAGTLNIARRDRGYFDAASLARARFLCDEVACAFDRIHHVGELEQELARAIRNSATGAASDGAVASTGPFTDAARDGLPDYLRCAVGHMRAHCAEPLTIEAIASVCLVSPRRLVDGFRRHFGTSPRSLLRELRFQKVRDALVAALPGATTVSDIATACGFNELGRFAVEYRRRYAETPSDTLRRVAPPSAAPAAIPEIFVWPDAAAEPGQAGSAAALL